MELERYNKKNRREFFQTAALLVGGALFSTMLKPYKVFANSSKSKSESDVWYGIGIDIEKCIGCGNCAKACKLENDVPQEPFYYRTWVEQYTIKNNEEIVVESPNGGIDGFKQSIPDDEIYKSFFVPKLCNHCHKSPCEQVCPVGATYQTPDGVVLVDDKYCIGCRYCVQACPYGCRFIHPVKKVASKCTLCYHRLKKGFNPACMDACPTGARIMGNLRDKNGELAIFLKEHNCHVLKPHLNTGCKLFYNGLNMEVS